MWHEESVCPMKTEPSHWHRILYIPQTLVLIILFFLIQSCQQHYLFIHSSSWIDCRWMTNSRVTLAVHMRAPGYPAPPPPPTDEQELYITFGGSAVSQ